VRTVALKLLTAYSDFRVSGPIVRIDITKAQGYNVWTFVRGDTDWKLDPRMPLLQEAAAKKLNVDLAGCGKTQFGTVAERRALP